MVVNNTTIVNQNFTVWRPQSRGAEVDHGDRGWGQPDVRTTVAPPRNEGARPGAAGLRPAQVVAEAQKSIPPSEARPPTPVREVRPPQSEVQRLPVRPQEAQGNSPREEVKPATIISSRETRGVPARQEFQPDPVAPRQPSPVTAPVTARLPVAASTVRPPAPSVTSPPAANAARRAPSGALKGIESSRATREASARGQQSREAITKPVTAPHATAATVPSPKANSAEARRPQQPHAN